MRLLVVNFSISNGGDFLIEERMNDLMERSWPEAKIDYVNGTKDFSVIDYTNYDMVLGGWTML